MHDNMRDGKCGFEETLIACLYGEATERERSAFESHVAGCANCTREYAAFEGFRSDMAEWSHEAVQIPPIPNPAETAGSDGLRSAGFVQSLLGLLTANRGLAAAGLAAAVLLAAAAPLVFRSGVFETGTELAADNTAAVRRDDGKTARTATPSPAPAEPEGKKTDSTVPEEGAGTTRRQSQERRPARETPKSAKSAKPQTNVTLTEIDEDEDESLRLSDLFAELGEI